MKKKDANYLEQVNLIKRLIYTQEIILEICEDFFDDLIKSENTKFKITFDNKSVSYAESEQLSITHGTKESVLELKEKIDSLLKRDIISSILIQYDGLQSNNYIHINIQTEPYLSSTLRISSDDRDWINSRFSGLDKILKKAIEYDYFSIPINIAAISIYLYLSFILGGFALKLSESPIQTILFLTIILILITSISLLSFLLNFLKKSCFPKVEFGFGSNNKPHKRNRKIFLWITGTIIAAIISAFIAKFF